MTKTELLELDEKNNEKDGKNHIDDLLSEEGIVQIVSFSLLNDVEYGVDILSIHEILKIPAVTRLPNVPLFIKGVLNLRGNVIPVVNVRARFGLAESPFTEASRIIVVEVGDKLIGLLVDEVYQVIRIPRRNIEQPSELIEGVSDDFIQGVGRLKDGLVVILRLENMLFPVRDEF